jgi:hypothetical protein
MIKMEASEKNPALQPAKSTEIHLTQEQLPPPRRGIITAKTWSGTFDKLEKYLVS